MTWHNAHLIYIELCFPLYNRLFSFHLVLYVYDYLM